MSQQPILTTHRVILSYMLPTNNGDMFLKELFTQHTQNLIQFFDLDIISSHISEKDEP